MNLNKQRYFINISSINDNRGISYSDVTEFYQTGKSQYCDFLYGDNFDEFFHSYTDSETILSDMYCRLFGINYKTYL